VLTVALALLAVWPSAASPFHEPKRWILVAGAVIGVLLTSRRPARWQWSALPLVAVATLQGGVETIAFAWALVTWPALPSPSRWQWRVLMGAMAISAGVVVLQALGIDVIGADVSGRLKLYGTLGNPDFVASALLPLLMLPLSPTLLSPTSSPPGALTPLRREREIVGVVALVLTRSFATVLSLAVAALALRKMRFVLLVFTAPIAVPLMSRDLRAVIEGRVYLMRVALPHVTDAPLMGLGPRAVERLWPAWELEYWKARCDDAACVEAHPDGRFAGLQDHVHADWLEWLIERGALGLGALMLALGAALRVAWKGNELVFVALLAAVARSFVDFPLERPADLAVIALLCSLAVRSSGPSSTSSDRPGWG
jgi:putative inorganic carbon (hco3(-)) transporter